VVGHVVDRLRELPDESVHCVVTSPPYYGLRSYGTEPQVWVGDPNCSHVFGAEGKSEQRLRNGIGSDTVKVAFGETLHPSTGAFCRCGAWRGDLGLEPTVEMFIAHMVEIFREVRRVLRKDGTLWLNIGDSYAASTKGSGGTNPQVGGGKRTILEGQNYGARKFGMGDCKPKDLLMIPAQLALALRADGWVLRSRIVWAKKAPMPESCDDRPTSAHEDIYLLAKSNNPTFWTHRDHEGSRTKPLPDYRWQQIDDHGRVVAEQDFAPPGFQRNWPHWKRINLWAAHDYFYDGEAVKEEGEGKWEESHYKYYRGKGTSVRNTNSDRGDTKAGERFAETSTNRFNGTRNMRNVWHLGPEPFPEAHFATFVSEIPRRAILAGTSARGVCPKCGGPWVRVVESKTETNRKPGQFETGRIGGDSVETKGRAGDVTATTLGWRLSCSCEPEIERQVLPGGGVRTLGRSEPIPATVLDPFLGSGTTMVVADRLGRSCVGIELSHKYAAMAERRLVRDVGPLVRGDIATVESGQEYVPTVPWR
jgi:DNA modification methylase